MLLIPSPLVASRIAAGRKQRCCSFLVRKPSILNLKRASCASKEQKRSASKDGVQARSKSGVSAKAECKQRRCASESAIVGGMSGVVAA